ncbi:MAG TPA: EscU/YscU/HrcU family type III secretion system export apparatus switch protein, partial [Polyangiaceae bacterium]|nr:EscU/YscU/HrcU family type III secretion system export apparatus switch protein [Polyangiaceae bacterium]
MTDKTEAPTPRRLRKAREEGDSGVSANAAQAVAFVVVVALVPQAARALASRASADLRAALAYAAVPHAASRFDPTELATTVASLTFPVLLAAGIAGAVAHAVQTGGIVASKKLTPKLERLDPIAGLKGLFSATRLFAVARAMVASAVVCFLAYGALSDHVVSLAHLVGRPRWIGAVLAEVAGGLAWRAALVGLAIGALDLAVTRHAWTRKLRMSKDEVRREHRDAEGDPQLKAARERAYHELRSQATIANVREASVVVVNPTHLACALRYDERRGDDAPVVVAAGEGAIAAQIAREALAHGIPVVRDAPLAR